MSDQKPSGMRGWSRSAVLTVAIVAAIGTAAIAALLVNIMEKKGEAQNSFFRVVELTDETEDPAIWGKNFPLQYDAYLRTVDQQRTRYGGSEAMPRTPTEADPRSIVAQSRLDEDPRLKTMWAGYAFATDFRKKRGHAYMLEDQSFTERVQHFKQPGTCIHCHASVYVPYKKAGNGDLIKGFEHFNQMPYADARKSFTHPVACIDCHAPDTMALRVTRPGFIEGIRALKASEGVKDYDVNTMATRQEMRGFVCGQCHVEYYFKGPEKRLTYPWAKGLKVEQIYEYYKEVGFTDWTHAETGAPNAQGAASRIRNVEPGHSRALRGDLQRLPHALHARGRAEDHRPSRAEPAAEHQPRLPDVSQVVRGGIARPRRDDPAAHRRSPEPGDGCARGAGRRHQERQGRGNDGGPAWPPRSNFSGVDSSTSTSSSRRTRTASTRHRKRRASSARPSTTCGRDSWRCGPSHAPAAPSSGQR